MKPGLYQVTSPLWWSGPDFCAGFVINPNGSLGPCAPILRGRFIYWKQFAIWIGP